jgi:hypothetical protein
MERVLFCILVKKKRDDTKRDLLTAIDVKNIINLIYFIVLIA